MKSIILGCIAGSAAAALLLNGCATDEDVADTYRSSYTGTYATTNTIGEPAFVERRIVTVNNTPRDVPIYRTGDSYFYTYGGRRYTLADYPETSPLTTRRVVRTRAYSSGRFRTADPLVVERATVDDVGIVPATRRTTTTTLADPVIVTDPAPVTTYRTSKDVIEIRR